MVSSIFQTLRRPRAGLVLAFLVTVGCGTDAVVDPGTQPSADTTIAEDLTADGTVDLDGLGADATATTDITVTDIDPTDAQPLDTAADATETADAVDTTSDDATQTDAVTDAPDVGCTSDEACTLAVLLAPCQVAYCGNDGQCATKPEVNGTTCDDSQPCTLDDVCNAGTCVGLDKVCNDGNPCTMDACSITTGNCLGLPVGGQCSDGNACTTGDFCQDGGCIGKVPLPCDDQNPCTDDACAPATGCTATPRTGDCTTGDACFSGSTCVDGVCSGGTAKVCDDQNACTSDSCDPKTGACVFEKLNLGACDDGDACTDPDVCAAGVCAGGKIGCEDNNPCTADGCDAKTGCTHTAIAGACDDGSVCTTGDACSQGKCTGAAKVCDDANPCTSDTCDAKTGCVATPNNDPCDLGTVCQTGQCQASKCVSIAQKTCNDGNPCTTDTCDAKNGCVTANVAEGAACGQSDACNAMPTCKVGTCAPGAKTDCGDGNPCTTDACDPKQGCMWTGNTLPCNDGNACTAGDACSGGKCKSGAPVDPSIGCDDQNGCTTDTCDPSVGCVHTNTTAACNDGNACTTKEACLGGKCTGGTVETCADGKDCTVDQCDTKTGACSWLGKVGPCEDGNPCTLGDTCKAGGCQAGPGAPTCDDQNPCTTDSCDPATGKCVFANNTTGCDDSNACTNSDACAGGKCAGKLAVTCDDGNVCTDDGCNPASGQCEFLSNTAKCEADPCTGADQCVQGKCIAGTKTDCNDKNPCTNDSCNPLNGKCEYAAVVDNSPCDDAWACTFKSSCQVGVCQPANGCSVFAESFACANNGAGWTLDKPANRAVVWGVDMLPVVPSQATYQCSLNFNDGKDYCDTTTGVNCQMPTGAAQSPTIDLSAAPGMPVVTFDQYLDLDTFETTNDKPQVTVWDAKANTLLSSHQLTSTANEQKKWTQVTLTVPAAAGKLVYLKFQIVQGGATSSTYNTGVGWYVDDLFVSTSTGGEVCGDGADNNGNGLADCADPACKGHPTCPEICDDKVDNDQDGATDCQDVKCSGTTFCGKVLGSDDFACDDAAWVSQNSSPPVVWAVDGSPGSVPPVTGKCTLNYNNGVDYAAASEPNAGLATWTQALDATGLSQVTAQFWVYQHTENAGFVDFDRIWLQTSTDDFQGCCGATPTCGIAPALCNTTGTRTLLVPVDVREKWVKIQHDLSYFAGKKFKLRWRFSTGDGLYNAYPGVFVDDLKLYGK
ncbi:MAG: hypothetical protein ACOYOB_10595 [Myxococcota bacterium]